jgi:hypothetical protein
LGGTDFKKHIRNRIVNLDLFLKVWLEFITLIMPVLSIDLFKKKLKKQIQGRSHHPSQNVGKDNMVVKLVEDFSMNAKRLTTMGGHYDHSNLLEGQGRWK